jgi:hypothetical protein
MSIYDDQNDDDELCDKKTAALIYAKRGWPVFPLKPNNKEPLVKGGFKAATCDVGQITKWWTEHPDANLGIPTGSKSGFWVIDVDIKDGKDGYMQLWDTLTGADKKSFKEALSLNLIQLTATEGLHILVQWSPDHPVRNSTNVIEGVDIRGEGGYIVVEPSCIGSNTYRWTDPALPLLSYEPWMDRLVPGKNKVKATSGEIARSKKPQEGTEDQPTSTFIAKLFTNPPAQGDRDNQLFQAAIRLARAGLHKDLASAICMAIGDRCDPPAVDLAADKVEYVYTHYRHDPGEVSFPIFEAMKIAPDEPVPESLEEWFTFLNRRFAAVLMGKDFFILCEKPDDTGLITKTAFIDWLANVTCEVPSPDDPDETIRVSVTAQWLAPPARRAYKDVVFDPSGKSPATVYNFWRGFAVESKQGDCSLYWTLLRDVICDSDEDLYRYVRKWMAHLVQYPGVNSKVALVLRGKQGTGKNTAIELFGRLFGKAFGVYDSTDRLLGRFSAHLKDKLLILADEAVWGGFKKDEGVLKAFITAEDRVIEHKGIDLYTVKNLARLVIASNESWAVPLGIDDRRFVICDLSDKRKGDLAFFSGLYRQMNEEGGLAALMYDLLNEDLSGWVPQQRPVNNDLRSTDLKIESMTPLQKFVFHWLDSGMLHCVERGWEEKYRQCARYSNEMRSIMFSEFYAAYLEWADKFNVHKDSQSLFSRRVLGQKGKEGMLPVAERLVSKLGRREGLMYTFPPLEDCRDAILRSMSSTADWNGPRYPSMSIHQPTISLPM